MKPRSTSAIAALLGFVLAGCATPSTQDEKSLTFEDPALARFVSRDLLTFSSDAELRTYAGAVYKLQRRIWRRQYAQASLPCKPLYEECPVNDSDVESLIVTASSASTAPSITNNQTVGVDEGDIVKQIGPFLLVLQDGRVFVIDTRTGLSLADRLNVYQDPDRDIWYDEMLIQDDRVIVTGYSYEDEGTDLTVLRLDRQTGKLSRDGVFIISSDDYYDVDNYATRIVGDRLVIYTPYEIDSFVARDARPVIRRWMPSDASDERAASGRPLLDARNIYRPVQATWAPTVHTISVCPLGSVGADLRCRSTAFTGPEMAEMYVSTKDVFLWVWPGWDDLDDGGECEDSPRPTRKEVLPSAVFRLSLANGAASVLGVAGTPFDQFSMDSREGEFRALADWSPASCYASDGGPEVALLRAPLRLFGSRFEAVRDERLSPLPPPGARMVENRFTEGWLVYSARRNRSTYPPDEGEEPFSGSLTAVPLAAPGSPVTLALGHNVGRLELVGSNVFVDGYHDDSGLRISLLGLGSAPSITATAHLKGRYESEGRSHAFNSTIANDGGALMGLPTVTGGKDAGSWWWRSESSDVTFLTFTGVAGLADAGELRAGADEPPDSYKCEVSCIDWYGNSRPIFTGGRIFALMGTEIVEGKLVDGRIHEVRRLKLTGPPS